MKISVGLILFSLFFSCSSGEKPKVTLEIDNKDKFVIKEDSVLTEDLVEELSVEYLIPAEKPDPNVKFKISSCQGGECKFEDNLILDKKLLNGKLKLILGGWHNCGYQKDAIVKKVSLSNDTLRLGVFHTTKISSVLKCKCYFMFDIEVNKVNRMPEVIYLGYNKYKDIELSKSKIEEIKSEIFK